MKGGMMLSDKAEDFFWGFESPVGVAWMPLSERKRSRKKDAFRDIKIRLVMKLENCTSEEAVEIIAARKEARHFSRK